MGIFFYFHSFVILNMAYSGLERRVHYLVMGSASPTAPSESRCTERYPSLPSSTGHRLETYSYLALPSDRAIRLLKLVPRDRGYSYAPQSTSKGRLSDGIQASLTIIDIDAGPIYDALS